MNRLYLILKSFISVFIMGLSQVVLAQSGQFPDKPVKIIVPFPPGGGIDVLIRSLSKELSERWKQPVIIENKPGAATFVGAEYVAKASPDGYTLLATTDPTFTSNRHLFNKMPYDPDKSFSPIIQMVKGDNIIFANPAVPVTDLKVLVAVAKDKKQSFSFASYGNGTQPQLVFGYLNKRESLDILHVPYKGIAPVMMAVAGREVDLSVASAGVAGEMIKGERIRPLAVAGKNRMVQFPNVPTTAEQGFPYLRSFIWYGLFAPAGTPPSIVAKLNSDVAQILKTPSFADRQVGDKGMTVIAGSPNELVEAIREDSVLIGEMVKASGIKPE